MERKASVVLVVSSDCKTQKPFVQDTSKTAMTICLYEERREKEVHWKLMS